MADALYIKDETLTDTADAIRFKLDDSALYYPTEFPDKIRQIQSKIGTITATATGSSISFNNIQDRPVAFMMYLSQDNLTISKGSTIYIIGAFWYGGQTVYGVGAGNISGNTGHTAYRSDLSYTYQNSTLTVSVTSKAGDSFESGQYTLVYFY